MQNLKYNIIIISTAAFIFYLFFAHLLAVTDPVESNYALTAKEMALSGDWISPKIYGKYWFDKPIFFYWIMAASFSAFGFSELSARIGSALFSALGVSLIYWFSAKVSDSKKSLAAAVILGTSLQYIVYAKLIHTDTALFFFANAALVFFYLGYIRSQKTRNWYLLMYPCLALAVLTKGPVGILLPAFIIFVFLLLRKNLLELKQIYLFKGMIIFAVFALPWYIVMYAKHGEAFIDTFFGIHNYLRATVSEYPKVNVIYYYPVLLIVAMLPWTGLGILSVYRASVAVWQDKCGLSLFCLLWIAAYLLFYSAMATKYPTYVFPVLFPLVLLISEHISFAASGGKNVSLLIIFPAMLMILIFMFLLLYFYRDALLYFIETMLALTGLSVLYQLKYSGDNMRMLKAAAASTVVVFLLLGPTVFPHVAEMNSGRVLAAEIKGHYFSDNIGYYRQYSTAAVFYSGKILTKIVGQEQINEYNPQAENWFRKYTMPVKSLAEFIQPPGAGKKNIVIVEKTKLDKFTEDAKNVCSFKVVGEVKDTYITEIYSLK